VYAIYYFARTHNRYRHKVLNATRTYAFCSRLFDLINNFTHHVFTYASLTDPSVPSEAPFICSRHQPPPRTSRSPHTAVEGGASQRCPTPARTSLTSVRISKVRILSLLLQQPHYRPTASKAIDGSPFMNRPLVLDQGF
jgi:hypothetical protein